MKFPTGIFIGSPMILTEAALGILSFFLSHTIKFHSFSFSMFDLSFHRFVLFFVSGPK